MNIGIVGTRLGTDWLLPVFTALLVEFPGFRLVSGGARGVDKQAEFLARKHDLPTLIHEAQWERRHTCVPHTATCILPLEVGCTHKAHCPYKHRITVERRRPSKERTFWRGAGYARNTLIVRDSDLIVAFMDAGSKGTAHTVHIALNQGKPVRIYDRRTGALLKACPCASEDTRDHASPPDERYPTVILPYEPEPVTLTGEPAVFEQYSDQFGRTQADPRLDRSTNGETGANARVTSIERNLKELAWHRIESDPYISEAQQRLLFEQTCGECGRYSEGGQCESCARDAQRREALQREATQFIVERNSTHNAYVVQPRNHAAPAVAKGEREHTVDARCWCGYSHFSYNPRTNLKHFDADGICVENTMRPAAPAKPPVRKIFADFWPRRLPKSHYAQATPPDLRPDQTQCRIPRHHKVWLFTEVA